MTNIEMGILREGRQTVIRHKKDRFGIVITDSMASTPINRFDAAQKLIEVNGT